MKTHLDSVLRMVPRDASSQQTLTPRCSKFNNYCTIICLMLALYIHLSYEYSDTQAAIDPQEDPWMVWFLQSAASLAAAGFFQELCVALDRCMIAQEDQPMTAGCRLRVRLNIKLIIIFTVLMTVYQCMAFDFQYVHKGWIAAYHKGHQVVYSVRYIEWVFCAPIVLSCQGHLPPHPDGQLRNALIPSSVLTGTYCIISWQGLVVKDPWAAWTLIAFAFVCFFGASYEQLYFAWYIKDKERNGGVRACLLVYLVIMMGLYGIAYLMPIPGWISTSLENKFYCIGDPSFKLGTSFMVLATVDSGNLHEMYKATEALAADLSRLIRMANVPIFGIDVNGKINTWNAKIEELTGIPLQDAMNLPLLSLIHDSDKEKVRRAVQGALDNTETSSTELTIDPKSITGAVADPTRLHTATLVSAATPFVKCSGNVSGAVFIGCDLTEVSYYRDSEAHKSQLMSMVSHELRSPLHGIISITDMLLDTETVEKRKKHMRSVSNCSKRLLELVSNIMEMASLSRNKAVASTTLHNDPTELPKIIEEIVLLVSVSVDKRGKPYVTPEVELINNVTSLPVIEADAHRCTQVFYNLITNACKFTKEGSITIASNVDPDGQWVEISVSDTGVGIAKENVKKIFEPFEQVDKSRARCADGIGLGLAIAYEVVHLHGGELHVDSEENVGTTFTARLPTVMVEPNRVGQESSILAPGMQESSRLPQVFGPQTVPRAPTMPRTSTVTSNCSDFTDSNRVRPPLLLSVDDSEVNQQAVTGSLGRHYLVRTAMSGQEALTFLETCRNLPDVILLDNMMPEMTGIDVCREVRKTYSKAELPIVMYSAAGDLQTMLEAYDAGVNDFIVKPIQKELMVAKLRIAREPRTLKERSMSMGA